jgi:hypothetical protein
MTWSYNPLQGSFLPTITLKHVATGTAGATVEIPDTPDDSGFSVSNFQIPRIPSMSFPAGLASSTGSSCCDVYGELGIGEALCVTVIRNSLTVSNPFGGGILGNVYFDQASNGQYSPTTLNITGLGTGTYSVFMEADYVDTSTPIVPYNVGNPTYIFLTYSDSTAIDIFPNYHLLGLIGQSGHVTISKTADMPAGKSGFLFRWATFSVLEVTAHCVWTNIRLKICKLSPLLGIP